MLAAYAFRLVRPNKMFYNIVITGTMGVFLYMIIAMGASNPAIARELYLSVDTVKTHVRNLFRKLEVTNRTQAALSADQFGLAAPASRR